MGNKQKRRYFFCNAAYNMNIKLLFYHALAKRSQG